MRIGAAALAAVLLCAAAARAETVAVGLLVPEGAERGPAGARLGIDDNNTTGKFTGQSFTLDEVVVPAGGDPAEAVRSLRARGREAIVSLLPAAGVLKATEAGGLILNAAARDESLRGPDCRPNLLHTVPDRAMLADALAQYLVKKRWTKWFLATGTTAEDQAFANALRRAAPRFGAKIVADKPWTFEAESKPEAEVPVFTQGPEHDVVLAADEAGAFGELLPYRTWSPRPVAGSAGLVPTAWHASAEDWGAVQLQNRFKKKAGRPMTEVDYAAWVAVRAVGEAAARKKGDLAASLLADDFSVAGFKGRQLSFRGWDGQLRQPLFLATESTVVAVAPVDGFMHPRTELDTLGTDKPETKCKKGPRP